MYVDADVGIWSMAKSLATTTNLPRKALVCPRISWLFLKRKIESAPESVHSLGVHYGVDGANLSRQYNEVLSGYRE